MRPVRAVLNLSATAVRKALGLLGKVRDLATGRDDDELWTREEQLDERPARSRSTSSASRNGKVDRGAAREAVTGHAGSGDAPADDATATQKAEGGSAVAVKERPSLAERLESVSGIGPAKREAILEVFDSEEELLEADVATLAQVDGISTRLAKKIIDELS